MKKVRLSAKAIIMREGKLFAMHHRDSDGDYHILPSGGQRNGENLISTIERECLEEAGAKVAVGDVMYIRDYIEDNHEFAGQKPGFHQVEIMFKCKLLDGNGIGKGERMDERQIGVSWLSLDKLGHYRLYPKILRKLLRDNNINKGSIYLGEVN